MSCTSIGPTLWFGATIALVVGLVASEKVDSIAEKNFVRLAETQTIWENEKARVDIVKEEKRYRLFVKPKNDTPFDDVSADTYVAMKRLIAPISGAFEKTFNFPDYTESLVESDTTFGFELLPASKGAPNELDVRDKEEREVHIVTKGRYSGYSLPSPTTLGVRVRSELSNSRERGDRPFKKDRKEIKRDDAFRLCQEIHKKFSGQDLVGLRVPSRDLEKNELDPVCSFCNINPSRVIDQTESLNVVLEKKEKPNQLLLVPKAHHEDGVSLSQEVLVDELREIRKLRSKFKEERSDAAFVVWRHQGMKAGQEHAHTYTHVASLKDSDIAEYVYNKMTSLA